MIFLIKSSVVIICLLAFYKMLLEKESFYSANRIYLLGCLAFACVLPFVTLPDMIGKQGYLTEILTEKIVSSTETIDNIDQSTPTIITNENAVINKADLSNTAATDNIAEAQIADPSDNLKERTQPIVKATSFNWIQGLYLFGVLILLMNLLAQIISLIWRIRKSKDKITDDFGTIVNMSEQTEPCSFFSYIFINPSSYDYDTYEQIINHEKIHVTKGHSVDLLISEIAVIILWFNPFIWLLRREIEKNIEYQTDDILVNGEVEDREAYQISLVNIACNTKPLAITTNYNQSLIKQRILKMNGKRSNKFNYWKYAFMFPLVAMLTLFLNRPLVSQSNVEIDSSNTPNEVAISDGVAPIDTAIDTALIRQQEPSIQKAIDSYSSKEKEEIIAPTESQKFLPILDEAKVYKSSNIANCEEFEEAVANGDLERVKEILKTLDPDCLKVNKNIKSNRKAVEELVAEKKMSDYRKETTTIVTSDEEPTAECLELQKLIREKDVNAVRERFLKTNIACLGDVNGDPNQSPLINSMLECGAELSIENDLVTVNIPKYFIDFRALDKTCDESEFQNLKKAINRKEKDKVFEQLKEYIPACPFNQKTQLAFTFVRKLLMYHPDAVQLDEDGIITSEISVTVNANDLSEDIPHLHTIGLKGEEQDESGLIHDIEHILSYIENAKSITCDALIAAIMLEDMELTLGLLESVDPNCFHRESTTTTTENGAFSKTKAITPLIAAVKEGNYRLVTILLAHGADPNFRVENLETPLIAATLYGNLRVVKLLVESGAELGYKDHLDMTAIDHSIMEQRDQIYDYLQSKKTK